MILVVLALTAGLAGNNQNPTSFESSACQSMPQDTRCNAFITTSDSTATVTTTRTVADSSTFYTIIIEAVVFLVALTLITLRVFRKKSPTQVLKEAVASQTNPEPDA